jgi:hypothetical protein
MNGEQLPFPQAVRVALLMFTAPLSCWAALQDPDNPSEVRVIGLGETIAALIGKVIDRTWPDPAAKAMATMELQKLVQAGEFKALDAELQAMQMQADVNKVEAGSADPFTSRWRPFIGWVCGTALAWHYIGRPLADWVVLLTGATTTIPAVELGDLIVILLGMLGLGSMRTVEKLNKATR